MKLAYYPGCSGRGTSAEYERSTRAVCRALEIGLKEISDWSCWRLHAGPRLRSRALLRAFRAQPALAAAEGAERVGTPCPSCLANLKTAKYRMQDEAFRDKVNAPSRQSLPRRAARNRIHPPGPGGGLRHRRHRRKVKKPLEGIKVACYYGCSDEPPRGHHAV